MFLTYMLNRVGLETEPCVSDKGVGVYVVESALAINPWDRPLCQEFVELVTSLCTRVSTCASAACMQQKRLRKRRFNNKWWSQIMYVTPHNLAVEFLYILALCNLKFVFKLYDRRIHQKRSASGRATAPAPVPASDSNYVVRGDCTVVPVMCIEERVNVPATSSEKRSQMPPQVATPTVNQKPDAGSAVQVENGQHNEVYLPANV
ncbi:hypothetical protein TSAR_016938 [Trichomalopsis sarcophagae]|uniref:Uncharacterized protein n=1 Tax=Trichomalopsis sarcophagae TaxID=543379 RepID=A0A232EH87_9HYME|nr:hypothetical protein TSAR_016938 [Trichomalopsis sarcophagae]